MTATSLPPLGPQAAAAAPQERDPIGARWAAVHEAAAAVAALAGGSAVARVPELPASLRQAGGWRLALAAQALEDLAAVMEPGLRALLSLHGSGHDPKTAAKALWEEFAAARVALLEIVPAA